MKEIEVDMSDVRPEAVEEILDAIAEAIEAVAHISPTTAELIVAVGHVFEAVADDGETMH